MSSKWSSLLPSSQQGIGSSHISLKIFKLPAYSPSGLDKMPNYIAIFIPKCQHSHTSHIYLWRLKRAGGSANGCLMLISEPCTWWCKRMTQSLLRFGRVASGSTAVLTQPFQLPCVITCITELAACTLNFFFHEHLCSESNRVIGLISYRVVWLVYIMRPSGCLKVADCIYKKWR